MGETAAKTVSYVSFFLLGVALLIALGFEFVNGFHDTANAVAPVIYTNSLPPNFAVVWSGAFNFLGVLLSTGTVADLLSAQSCDARQRDGQVRGLASETIGKLQKSGQVKFSAEASANRGAFKKEVDNATQFIPLWVKVAVAIAIGLGTMVGWNRIVVTVGENLLGARPRRTPPAAFCPRNTTSALCP